MKTTISSEYNNQKSWRNWNTYLEKLPIDSTQTVLDIGCGTGDLSVLLSQKAQKITAIDKIDELIQFAKKNNSKPNVEFICGNVKDLSSQITQPFDGIWSSFGVAYFTNLETTLQEWSRLVKKGGWIAITEVNDMFAHNPMSQMSKSLINKYYQKQKANGTYDFLSGPNLRPQLENAGFKIIHDLRMKDPELAFDGIANPDIIQAWETRMSRMKALQSFLGEENFAQVKSELIDALKHEQHECKAEVYYLVAKKE